MRVSGRTASLALTLLAASAAWAQPAEFEQTPAPAVDLRESPTNPDDPDSGTPILDEKLEALQRAMSPSEATPGEDAPDRQPTEDPSLWANFLRGVVALFFVLSLILLGYYLLHRFGKRSPFFAGTGLGEILGRLALAPKAYLYFIRTGDSVLVIGWTPTSITRLAEFDAEEFQQATDQAESKDDQDKGPGGAMTSFEAFKDQLVLHGAEPPEEPENKTEQKSGSDLTEDLASLRSEIERLQNYLQETTGESKD